MTKSHSLPTPPSTPAPPTGGGRRRGNLRAVPAKDSQRVTRLQERLGLSQTEMARLLETSASTLARRPLTEAELDRLTVVEELATLAGQIVSEAELPAWLAVPTPGLAGAAPRELLASESGRRRLETFLLRALDGTVY